MQNMIEDLRNQLKVTEDENERRKVREDFEEALWDKSDPDAEKQARFEDVVLKVDPKAPNAMDRILKALYPTFKTQYQWDGKFEDRKWIIEGWLPVGRLGSFTGRGARGKSRLALQLAARIAARVEGPFIEPPRDATPEDKRMVKRSLPPVNKEHCGPVVYASWEDEMNEIGRRLKAMSVKDGLFLGDVLEDLHFIDLREHGPLWAPEGGGHTDTRSVLQETGKRLRATAKDLGAHLLIVDSVAAAFMSNENNRGLVRAFCADWDAWASANDCAVMLIAHPSKAKGKGEDTGYSGSTDWHNAPRWRWELDHKKPEPESKEEGQAPALSLAKSSYGPTRPPLFLTPSKSQIGWCGVSAQRAAADAKREQSEGNDNGEAEEEKRIRHDGSGPA